MLLASHPSLTGIKPTAACQARPAGTIACARGCISRRHEADDGTSPDLRELEVRKNNYGPSGEVIRMRWQSGVFVPVSARRRAWRRPPPSGPPRICSCNLFDRLTAQGQTLSHAHTSPTLRAARFAKHRDANGTGKATFAAAMQRLLDAGTIRVETYGRPSRPYSKLVRT